MTINSIANELELSLVCGDLNLEFEGVYVGDLLSRAMSRVESGNLFVTIMANVNVIAVASLTEAAAVILCEGVELPEDALSSAEKNEITVLSTPLSAYTVCCRIHDITAERGRNEPLSL